MDKIKNLEIIIDDLERRLRVLEKDTKASTGVNLIEENQIVKSRTKTISKSYVLNAKESTCACLRLECGNEEIGGLTYTVSCGDQTWSSDAQAPFLVELPLFLKVGKNVVTLEIEVENFTGELSLPLSVKISGKFDNQPIEPYIDFLNDKYIAHFSGCTLSVYDAYTLELLASIGGVERCDAIETDGEINLLYKNLDGEYYLARYDLYTFDLKTEEPFKESFSDCALYSGGWETECYFIKSNILYYTSSAGVDVVKLPIKAKSVRYYRGDYERYVYCEDINGNWQVFIRDYDSDGLLKKYSLGKLKNLRLYEKEGVLYALYKWGEGVAQKNLDSGEIKYLAVGDECLQFYDDRLIIRRGNNILKGEYNG